jgi:hypothetical protein
MISGFVQSHPVCGLFYGELSKGGGEGCQERIGKTGMMETAADGSKDLRVREFRVQEILGYLPNSFILNPEPCTYLPGPSGLIAYTTP